MCRWTDTWEMETPIKIIILLSKQCNQMAFFFFSHVPSFETSLGLGKTFFVWRRDRACKYQSVARLYSGGKRVELSTTMVS